MATQKTELTTTKLTPLAIRLIRLIAAVTGKTQFETVERLLRAEAERLGLPKHLMEK